jgi:hypothetical protein
LIIYKNVDDSLLIEITTGHDQHDADPRWRINGDSNGENEGVWSMEKGPPRICNSLPYWGVGEGECDGDRKSWRMTTMTVVGGEWSCRA